MIQKLLIPKNFRFMGKTQAELYKEAISKKEEKPIKPTPKSIREVIPLIDSDGETSEFTLRKALSKAKKQNKCFVSLKDADAYVLKHGGYYWTGDLIAYCAPGARLGQKLVYFERTDGNGVPYQMQIPAQFKDLTGETALILPYGNDPKNPNYEFIQGANNLQTVKIIRPDLIIQTKIKRQDGYYKADANMFPNGDKLPYGGTADNTYRYLLQVNHGPYLGLLRRGVVVGQQNVDTQGWPSLSNHVLVYEQ